MMNEVILYEELAMNAHPALQTQLYDGWVLRFSNGYTSRANSVSMLYPSNLPIEDKVAYCEQIYASQGLPAIFKLINGSPVGFSDFLRARGYEAISPSCMFVCDTPPALEIHSDVTITRSFDPQWKQDYFRLNGTNPALTATASAMMNHIQGNVFCAKIIENGKAVACGLCVEERGYAGLFDIIVSSAHRGRGLGHALCGSLMNAAMAEGAKSFYLQVFANNAPAIALYHKLGFARRYNYLYYEEGDRMTIRPFTMNDYNEVYALWNASLVSPRDIDDSREAVERFLRRNPGLSVIAEINGTIAGSILCGHDGRRGFLYRVAVDATQRRMGIGQAMVQACLANLRKEDISSCALVTFKTNAMGNAFWPAQGFRLDDSLGYYLIEGIC